MREARRPRGEALRVLGRSEGRARRSLEGRGPRAVSGTPPWGPGRERLTLDPSQRQTRGDLTMARLWGGEEEGVRAAQGFGPRASEGRGPWVRSGAWSVAGRGPHWRHERGPGLVVGLEWDGT